MNAIKKNKAVQLGTNETLADRGPFLDKIANKAYEMVLENKFDRGDEMDADKVSVTLTAEGSATRPARSADVPRRGSTIATRISPPPTACSPRIPTPKERIDAIRKLAGGKSGALVEARYKANIKYEPTPITAIATVEDGAAGLTGSTAPAKRRQERHEQERGAEEEAASASAH